MSDDAVLARAAELGRAWRGSLAERPVGLPVDPTAMAARLDGPLPDDGDDPTAVLETLVAAMEPGLVAAGGPRYFGFVTGGALPAALAADWVVSATDQNAATYVMSPAAATVEAVVAGWLLDLLGLPPTSAVGFVTGAQMATVSCLAAARHALLAGQGWDVEADGLAGAPVPTVVLGEHAHATVHQALRFLGFGSNRALTVAADDQGRMRPEALRATLADARGPVLVCAQAGQVDTGASDPFDAVADVVGSRTDAWLHVDGAFGLWAAVAPSRRDQVAGVGRADSWAVDGHKWLNVPYDAAMAVVRSPDALRTAMSLSASYLPVGARDPSAYTPESSRRARAVPVYAALRSLGRRGVADLVERCCALARQAAAELADDPRVEILGDVVLNQVLFRVTGVDTAALLDAVARDGTCWVGGTVWRGEPAIRFSVSNHATTPADISRSTAAIRRLIDA